MVGRLKASKGRGGPQGDGDAACRANNACSEVSKQNKCGALMEDRALLTALLEAAASGNKDSLLAAIRKVAQRYGTRNVAAAEASATEVAEGGEATATPAKRPTAASGAGRGDAATARIHPEAAGKAAAEGTECELLGMDPDLLLGFRDGEGRTIAHFAALGGSAEVLELVLRLCPSAPNARDSYGKTPLFTAASLGNTEVLQLLLHNGGDAAARSKGGSTAVHEAIFAQKGEVVKLLLERGANVGYS